jgi:hypothetical protein
MMTKAIALSSKEFPLANLDVERTCDYNPRGNPLRQPMSKDAWIIIGLVVLGIIVLGAVWVTLRGKNGAGIKRSKVKVNGPFGMGAQAESSNDVTPGVRIHDAQSQAGGLSAEDKTGRGVNLSKIVTKNDITVSNTPPPPADPKA